MFFFFFFSSFLDSQILLSRSKTPSRDLASPRPFRDIHLLYRLDKAPVFLPHNCNRFPFFSSPSKHHWRFRQTPVCPFVKYLPPPRTIPPPLTNPPLFQGYTSLSFPFSRPSLCLKAVVKLTHSTLLSFFHVFPPPPPSLTVLF